MDRERDIVRYSGGGEVVTHRRDGSIRDSDTIAAGQRSQPASRSVLKSGRELRIEIIAVQPGVSVCGVQGWPAGRALLHAADGWCMSENVQFRLLEST